MALHEIIHTTDFVHGNVFESDPELLRSGTCIPTGRGKGRCGPPGKRTYLFGRRSSAAPLDEYDAVSRLRRLSHNPFTALIDMTLLKSEAKRHRTTAWALLSEAVAPLVKPEDRLRRAETKAKKRGGNGKAKRPERTSDEEFASLVMGLQEMHPWLLFVERASSNVARRPGSSVVWVRRKRTPSVLLDQGGFTFGARESGSGDESSSSDECGGEGERRSDGKTVQHSGCPPDVTVKQLQAIAQARGASAGTSRKTKEALCRHLDEKAKGWRDGLAGAPKAERRSSRG